MEPIPVDPNWWKHIFDRWYLVTDYRSVCNQELTSKEVSSLIELLDLKPDDRILDLCGGEGRHSIELWRRGFEHLSVLDYSEFLLRRGRRAVESNGARVGFIRSDARNTGCGSQSFTAIIIMGNSFGYFTDDRENRRILAEAIRLLAPGGRLLLDLADRDHVFANFTPESTHPTQRDGLTVKRVRRLEENVITAREMVLDRDGGIIRDCAYCERLFTPLELEDLLRQTGFSSIRINPGFMDRSAQNGDFGFMTNRTVAVAVK